MPQVFRRRVAFSETDASGRVHFTELLKWAEDAEHQLLKLHRVSVFSEGEGWPRARVECDYRLPLNFEEEVAVEIGLVQIGNKSLHWKFRILNRDAAVAVEGTMVTVFVCKSGPPEIPELERQVLSGLLEKED